MDIKGLRAEIDNRKKQLDERKNVLGEKTQVKPTGDQFLKELVHTRQTGVATNASITVKAVDVKVKAIDNASLLNHVPAPTSSVTPNAHNPTYQPSASEVARMDEAKRIRETANNLNTQIPQPSNATISDALAQYQNIPQVGAPMQNNGMLNEQQMMHQYAQNGGGVQAPNTLIVEQVHSIASQLLNENFGNLYAEAMKNSIIETYKAEVIKEAINENRSVIEQIVRETIIDLQKKSQSK